MSEYSGGAISELSDGELLGLAQSGQRAAFEVLFHRHQDRVYSIALGILGDANEARDVVQETFLRAYKRLGSLNQDKGLLAYICRTASNAAIDILRSRRPARTVSLDARFELGFDTADPQSTPDIQVIRDSQADVVLDAVVSLPEEQRLVIVLHHLEGLQLDEISSRLKIPVGTVKSRLGRGREMLRRKLVGRV